MFDKKKTILAIDDDITILATMRGILEGTYDVSLAKNLDIAKTILQTIEVNMILLDMDMPGLSGMDFLDELQKSDSYYHIPVIIVSSYGTADVIVEAKKGGASDFVVKPIVPKTLLGKIHSVFKTARRKITHESLVRNLKFLETTCLMGKSSNVEEIITNLEHVYCDKAIDLEIAEICKHARNMDYSLVAEKIKPLLANLE